MSSYIEKTFDSETKEYWVVFTQGTHLVSKFLKKNFSHVYVITRDKYNWIVLNPMRLQMLVEIAAVPISDDLPRLITLPTDRIIKVTMHKRKLFKQFRYFGLLNCVTHALYLLGLRIYVITPFQLYVRLLRLSSMDMAKHGIQSIRQLA